MQICPIHLYHQKYTASKSGLGAHIATIPLNINNANIIFSPCENQSFNCLFHYNWQSFVRECLPQQTSATSGWVSLELTSWEKVIKMVRACVTAYTVTWILVPRTRRCLVCESVCEARVAPSVCLPMLTSDPDRPAIITRSTWTRSSLDVTSKSPHLQNAQKQSQTNTVDFIV